MNKLSIHNIAGLTIESKVFQRSEEGLAFTVVNIPAPVLVSDTLDIPPGTARALAFNLAVEVESDFGMNLSQNVYRIADLTKDRLEAEIPLDLSVDMSDLAFTFNYDIESDN